MGGLKNKIRGSDSLRGTEASEEGGDDDEELRWGAAFG